MASIFDLKPLSKVVELDGLDIAVYAVSIEVLLDALGAAGVVEGVLRTDKRAPALVAAILARGATSINRILAAGLREDPARIAELQLPGVYQAQLLVAIVDISLPDTELGKVKAAAATLGARLGLIAPAARSEMSGQS